MSRNIPTKYSLIWIHMVQYLHFSVLKFPLKISFPMDFVAITGGKFRIFRHIHFGYGTWAEIGVLTTGPENYGLIFFGH